ncbi:tetratricopeptide repeat protein [Salinispira pacifica]
METGVSALYFDSAKSLFEAGRSSEADSLLRIALEYDPQNADAHYLLGRILATDQSRTIEAESELLHAVRLNQFHVYLQSDCALQLAELYLRTHRFTEGIEILHRYGRETYPDAAQFRGKPDRGRLSVDGGGVTAAVRDTLSGSDDPRYARVLVRLLLGAGEEAQARSVLSDGLQRFPDDTPLRQIFFLLDPVPSLAASAWLDNHNSRSADFLAFLLAYIRALPDGPVRSHFLDLYFSDGGSAPEAWALSAGLSKSDSAALSGFVSAGGFPSGDSAADVGPIRTIDKRITDPPVQSELKSRLVSFTGTLGFDTNHDGYNEQLLEFTNGVLTTLAVDQNQDGVPEETIHFDGGPVSVDRALREQRPDSPPIYLRYTIGYGEYPRVASVRFDASELYPGWNVEYLIRPGSLTLPILQNPPSGGYRVTDVPALASVPTIVGETEIRGIAFRALLRSDGSERVRRVLFLKQGVPFLAALDNGGAGTVDEVIEYRGGVPIMGIRDLNDDGYFEESEFYTDGRVSYLAVDANHDGVPEYFEQISPTVTYAWDLNGDGRVDAKDIVIGRNEVTRLFSTELNGTLDRAINMKRFLMPARGSAAP